MNERKHRGQPVSAQADRASVADQQAALERLLARPQRAPGVQLLGEMQESGFKDRQWLARRDGRFIQLTEPLYRVLEYSDGTRSPAAVAQAVTDHSAWAVGEDIVRHIILTKLLPLGLVGEQLSPSQRPSRSSSALSVNLRMKMLQPQQIERITSVLQWLYAPRVLIPLLILIVAAHGWMYFIHGISRGIHQAFYTPGLLLAVFGILLVSIVFHEFGHASALRYGGGRVGEMGVGFYLMYPAFYTDTTDSYRLGRWARVRTDLGGFYFHLLFSTGAIIVAAATGLDFLLFVSVLVNADMVRQLLPFARFDGYWALVDLTGMPDFFSQIKPFLRGFLRSRVRDGKLPSLKGWVKGVFIAYIVVTLPALLLLLVLTVTRLPMIAGVLSGSLRLQVAAAGIALRHGNRVLLAAAALQMLLLSFEVVGITHLLYVSVARPLLGVWNRVNPLPPTRRAATATTAVALCLGTVFAFPQVLYTPGDLAGALSQPVVHAAAQTRAPHRIGSSRPSQSRPVPQVPTGVGGAGDGALPATSAGLALPPQQSVSRVVPATRHASSRKTTSTRKSCLSLLQQYRAELDAQHGISSKRTT
jgi:putative peptide zinc metalloprotease protein